MSTEKLKVALGLLIGHTTLRAHIFKPWFTLQQDYQLCGDKKKIVYVLYVIAWHWHAKDTESWVVCS